MIKNRIYFLILCFFTVNAYSMSCENFPKYQFLGVFSKVEYECEENNNRGSTCYTRADRYMHISNALINFIPLAIEEGVQIKLEDGRFPLRAPVFEHTFRDKTANDNESLSCSTSVIDGIETLEMKSSSSLDHIDFKSHTLLRKRGEVVEFEIYSEYNGETSNYLFRLIE